MPTLQEVKDRGIDLVWEYLSSLGADITSRTFFGGYGTKQTREVLNAAEALIREGKPEEAKERIKELHANIGGFGLEDEEIFWEDLLAVQEHRGITRRQYEQLIGTMNKLNARVRSRVRRAHSKQEDVDARRAKLARWAKFTPKLQRETLVAVGLDGNTVDEVFNAAELAFRFSFRDAQTTWRKKRTSLIRDLRRRARRP